MIVFLQSLGSRKIQSSRLLAPRRQYPFVGGKVKRQLRRIGEAVPIRDAMNRGILVPDVFAEDKHHVATDGTPIAVIVTGCQPQRHHTVSFAPAAFVSAGVI
ncbi:hypothetical protein [Paraburkholderia sp. 40]|uniref:hypothetical protein n=1 Tax=Paraburkholderia sp. 40 TaxID=2991059 RepID=UPI003D1B9C85